MKTQNTGNDSGSAERTLRIVAMQDSGTLTRWE